MLQYLYWEKVLPQEGDCAFNPKLSIRPLMRNWNEAATTRRDNFDYENGRGRGNVKIEDNITEEYRMQEPVVPDPVPSHQEKAKPVCALPKKNKAAKPIDNDQMDVLINRLTGYLDKQFHKLFSPMPDLCAQRTLEPLNKEGVMYKPADAAVSGNMEDEEDVGSFQNGPREKKEFMYKKDSDSEGGGEYVCLIIDMTEPDSKPDPSSDLTPELIDAAIVFLELASRSDQHKKKNVYRNSCGDKVNAERLRVVLDRKWLSDDVIDGYLGHLALRVGRDRFLCPAWRSKFLVDRAIAGDKVEKSSKNMDHAMAKSGTIGRVLEEYTVRDKTFFPLNIGNTHWMTVVMHMPKQEFQVLDSLYPLDLTLETVEALRRQIGQDMQVANAMMGGNYPDVTKWPIKEYNMPQQRDG
ncbi:hypothetical protein ACQ4PT_014124 [Festuca glaucescens]